jgi:hypothetical protein
MPVMRCFKGWLQALAGGMAMCVIMLVLIALACTVLVFTTAVAMVVF